MIDSHGFTRPTREQILQAIKDDIVAKFSETIGGVTYQPSLEPESFLGAFAEILTQVKEDLYQVSEDSYYSNFLGTAQGVQLDRIALPTKRKQATKAKATLRITGTPGTNVPAGFVVETEDKRKYQTDAPATIGAGGTVDVGVTAQVAGAAGNAPIGALTFIPVPLTGVTSVTNISAAQDGKDTEADAEFRKRAIDDRSLGITSSLSAILNRVLQVEGVIDAVAQENTTLDYIGIIPPGGFEITVRGGADLDIGNAIFSARPAGIASAGTQSVTVYDVEGNPHIEKFSRVVDVAIYVNVALTVNSLYNATLSNPEVKRQILKYIGGVDPDNVQYPGLKIGEDVVAWKAKAMLFDVNNPGRFPGLADAVVKLAKVPAPINLDTVVIDTHEEAYTDFAKINITVTVI
jgi:uncharacterized phage protein gp47/JayE